MSSDWEVEKQMPGNAFKIIKRSDRQVQISSVKK